MACSACVVCNCNPCSCGSACDPVNEALSSQVNNLVLSMYGSVTKTCVNGQVIWSLPCDLDDGVPGFPRNSGEGIACYLIRYAQEVMGQPLNFANTVYVDKNWALLSAIGVVAFGTVQEAYDYANPQASITNPWVIRIGPGTRTDFGGIRITADWNTYVSLFGSGEDITELDSIDGSNDSGNAYNVTLIASNLALRLIDTSTAGAFVAGNINMTFNTGSINQSSVLALDLSAGVGGTGGNLVLDRNLVGEVRMGSNSPGTIRALRSKFQPFAADNCIDNLNGGSTLSDCIFRTSNGGTNCIANVTSNGAQFTNCLFIPATTGYPITASVARTIVSYNNISKNALNANVTLSEGTFTVMTATMRQP